MSKIHLLALLAVLLPAGGLAAGFLLAPGIYEEDLATPFVHREAAWTGSTTCQSCHPDQFASWDRTFHSTMTQEATPKSVVGAFNGENVTYWGVTTRPVRRGDDFFIEYIGAGGQVAASFPVKLTVGSRRFQQYVVDIPNDGEGETLYRIPLLWNIPAKRWIHLNGAFLGHDSEPYDTHTTTWNQNCIFCHNTGPRPGSINYDDMIARALRGERVNAEHDGRFVSEVAEHGISCESCHAPAGEHADRNRNPLRRYLLHLNGADDPTIVNPAKLTKERSAEVCGQCHGQRLPPSQEAVRDWMIEGPTYRAGDVLAEHVQVTSSATPGPPHMPDMFERRFWNDGTPRLTAHEYQGLTMSPCFQQGELTCISCHTMHGGDIFGQVEPETRTNEACRSCHEDLVDNPEPHTYHGAESTGSLCYSCHMPKVTYGVQEIHRSHRIEKPKPAADVEAARPNACTLCHVDQTAVWAAEKSREWWGDAYEVPTYRGDGAPLDAASSVAALFAGDPVQRAVAARLAGRRDTPLSIEERAFLYPVLLQCLEDGYPTVRWMCRSSLLELQEEAGEKAVPGLTERLERFDYIVPKERRDLQLAEMRRVWAEFSKGHLPAPPAGVYVDASYELVMSEVAPLLALKSNKMIHIGE